MLASGANMIRVTAKYELLTDVFDVVDRITDGIMDTLMSLDTISEPDVAVSMTEQVLEIWFVVATTDVSVAMTKASEALAVAFAANQLTAASAPDTYVHPALIGPGAQMATELVPA